MRRRRSCTGCPAGYSLIELVIVISLVGLIAGLFVTYLDEGTRMFETVDARRELMMEARQAMIRTVREIRQVRSGTDVIAADDSTFVFFGVDDSLYAIRFSGIPDDEVVLRRGSLAGPIATVDSFVFEYFKTDGTAATPTVSPASTDIYRVGIRLRMTRGPHAVTLRTGTFLRNL